MAKRSKSRKATPSKGSLSASEVARPNAPLNFKLMAADRWLLALLMAITFLVYWPSLSSDFVYDSREEILEEGFITSLSNLPAVLSGKVLEMNLMLGTRPGQLLYLMLNAALWGREPFGYHLASNLFHVANVALLYLLLRRLCASELAELTGKEVFKVQVALAAATLLFALHPICVEPVSAINFSSDLLVTFFTLFALLAATCFRPDHSRVALGAGIVVTVCAFAAVTCKESGAATAFLLLAYWFFFRRGEAKGPWLMLIMAAVTVTTAFLVARFNLAPPGDLHPAWLGGSFSSVLLVQPTLWVFMLGQLLWPVHLSADYTLQNVTQLGAPVAVTILAIILLLQGWLAVKSRLGAMGVAIYWLGLATVSNFIPLYRILADRFYYLPMVSVALQVAALLLMIRRWPTGFWAVTVTLLVVLIPLTALTLRREAVFAGEIPLWTDTLQASPFSATAHNGLGLGLYREGRMDEALAHFQMALKIDPNHMDAQDNYGVVLGQMGQLNEAMVQLQKTVQVFPNFAKAHSNLGIALFQSGQADMGMAEFQKALAINSSFAQAHFNLGQALVMQGQFDQGIAQLQEALRLNPTDRSAQKLLQTAETMAGRKAAHP